MSRSDAPGPDDERLIGLCGRCRHARVQTTGRGSRFWRCLRAERDPRFARYPVLPVHACPGFEAGARQG